MTGLARLNSGSSGLGLVGASREEALGNASAKGRHSVRKMSVQQGLRDKLGALRRRESARKASEMIFVKQASKLQKQVSRQGSFRNQLSRISSEECEEEADEECAEGGGEKLILEFNKLTNQFQVVPTRTMRSFAHATKVFDQLESTTLTGQFGLGQNTTMFAQTEDSYLVKALSFYMQSTPEDQQDQLVEYYVGNVAFDRLQEFPFYKKHNNFSAVIEDYTRLYERRFNGTHCRIGRNLQRSLYHVAHAIRRATNSAGRSDRDRARDAEEVGSSRLAKRETRKSRIRVKSLKFSEENLPPRHYATHKNTLKKELRTQNRASINSQLVEGLGFSGFDNKSSVVESVSQPPSQTQSKKVIIFQQDP